MAKWTAPLTDYSQVEFAPFPEDGFEFERLPPDVVAIEKQQREELLAQRNAMDRQHAEAAEAGRLRRAFESRAVGDTTAGKLNPL